MCSLSLDAGHRRFRLRNGGLNREREIAKGLGGKDAEWRSGSLWIDGLPVVGRELTAGRIPGTSELHTK